MLFVWGLSCRWGLAVFSSTRHLRNVGLKPDLQEPLLPLVSAISLSPREPPSPDPYSFTGEPVITASFELLPLKDGRCQSLPRVDDRQPQTRPEDGCIYTDTFRQIRLMRDSQPIAT